LDRVGAVTDPSSSLAAPAAALAPARIQPRRLPLTYRAGLTLSAVVMLILPLLYFGLIGAAAWGLWWYVAGAGISLRQFGGATGLIVYLAPLAIGPVLILFLIKPLFSPGKKPAESLLLDLGSEPRLREWIASICTTIGAPMPAEVRIDCEANASAGFRRGPLGLIRRDLVLTIGLPLVADLNCRQFGAVLAHEFGHFTQTGGLAATQAIRRVNAWFSRVVFQRDRWDAWLARASTRGDVRVVIILATARQCIWLARRILHGLMYCGHAATCYQCRQMEFDADYYAVHFAGTDATLQLLRELPWLNAGVQGTRQQLDMLWRDGRLVDDLPSFIAFQRSIVPGEFANRLETAANEERSKWSNTHPTRRQREEHARALNQPGIYREEAAARDLFADFGATARRATLHYYNEQLRLKATPAVLVDTPAVVAEARETSDQIQALRRLARGTCDSWRPVLLSESDLSPAGDAAALRAVLADRRQWLQDHGEELERLEQDFQQALQRRQRAQLAVELLGAGGKVKAKDYGIGAGTTAAAEAASGQFAADLAARRTALAAGDAAFRDWLVAASRMAAVETADDPGATTCAAELRRLAGSFASLSPVFRCLGETQAAGALLAGFLGQAPANRKNVLFGARAEGLRRLAEIPLAQGVQRCADVAYPFPHSRGPINLATFVAASLQNLDPYTTALRRLQLLNDLYYRLLGRIVFLHERGELRS
jgi:hypothetical protein